MSKRSFKTNLDSYMRRLPTNLSPRQKLILKATYDFFGYMTYKEKVVAKRIAIWIMGRRKGNKLTEENFNAVWHIRSNLKDNIYSGNLC